MTFSDLEERATRVGRALLQSGVTPGSRVGVLCQRSPSDVVALVGILMAGCAYVPLDPSYPDIRLQAIASDCGLQAVVGDAELARHCGLGRVRAHAVPDLLAVPGLSGGSGPALPRPGPQQAAYVIYTSGSTGQPKGCIITHGNVMALMSATLPLFDFGPDDRWSLFHSFSFDFSVWELWGALLTGATAVCVSRAETLQPELFIDLLVREGITVLNQVPSAFRSVARLLSAAGGPPPNVRHLIFGGESIDLDVVHAFLETMVTRPRVSNMYGITETTIHATLKKLDGPDYQGLVRSPIGSPLPHLEFSLRDELMAEVTPGQPGELLIAGPAVSQGYLGRPDLTAERFPVLATMTGQQRFYRTGDVARQLPSGEYEYLGRADDQVKIRGFRIEPGEIEAVLRAHGHVADAAVTVVPRGRSGKVLAAIVVPLAAEAPPGGLAKSLRAFLADRLPAYMVPGRLDFVPALPRAPSGKLDRRAVPGLLSAGPDKAGPQLPADKADDEDGRA